MQITELHVYDFDGTLFKSPAPPVDWDKGMGAWYSAPGSLLPPCVPANPGNEWWYENVVESAKQSISDPSVLAVMMTGRSNNTGLRYRIAELLNNKNLDFTAVYLKEGVEDTAVYKSIMLEKLLKKFPSIQSVHMWDDRHHHFESFENTVKLGGISFMSHPVNHISKAAKCNTVSVNESIGKKDYESVYKTAQQAHLGQLRRSGEPYFSHPSSVRNIVRKYYPKDKISQLAALLHDTLEDAPKYGTVKSVREMEDKIIKAIGNKAIADEVLKTVRRVTHETGNYTSYVLNLLPHPRALRVKFSDMEHNLQTASDKQRDKYNMALTAVANLTGGGPPTGVSVTQWNKLFKMSKPKELNEVRAFIKKVLSESADPVDVGVNELDPTMPVITIYPEAEQYEQFREYFKNTHAFNWLEKNIMIVDGAAVREGWFTDDHLLVMQAHELGHKVAGHIEKQQLNHRDPILEREADWVGYNILKNRGYEAAALLHKKEFEDRYGTSPDKVAGEMVHLMDVIQ